MKHFLLITLLTLTFIGCKKEINNNPEDYLTNVKRGLTDSLSRNDFENLDFTKSFLTRVDSVKLYVLRIPFKGKSISEDFVAVKTNVEGKIEHGRIVHLEGKSTEYGEGIIKRKRWDGAIAVSSLKRVPIFNSSIVNGYITEFHLRSDARTATLQPGLMPEVIITYTIHTSGISWSTWMMVQSFFLDYGNGGGSWGYYYGNIYDSIDNPGGGGGGGGGDNTGGPIIDETMLIDIENQDDKTAIDIQKFINCFNAIPDAGSTCSIEILTDIPVDKDPNKIFDFGSNSPGHTFLNIRKQNGSQSVSQNIGFYPAAGWKTILTNAPIDGKFVDNGQHEFNAGFKINITPEKLNSAFMEMLRDKNNKYDIDNYNCTDWAMDVFNAAGANFQIPLYDIPGNYPSTGTRMPNGVYNRLKEMKAAGDPQAPNINIGFVKAWAGTSTGPCN